MPTREALQLMERYNRAVQGLEDATVQRLHTAMDRAYRDLERDLRKTYPAIAENRTLLATQRKVLLLEQLGETLQVVRPDDAQFYQQTLQETLQTANQTGRTMADELAAAIAPTTGIAPLADIPIEAAALQARDGWERLRRHSEEFRDKAGAVIEQGLIQGWGPSKVSDILRSQLQITKGRAETIARTEILSALNDAAQERYQQNGIEHVQWIVTIGDVCFPAGVLVMTAQGEKPIESITEGELVLTRKGFKPVSQVMARNYSGKMVLVKAGDRCVEATANHPFWTPAGWTEAQSLAAGSTLQTFNNELIDVDNVQDFFVRKPKNTPSFIGQIAGFPGISSDILVPVGAVNLDSDREFWNHEINRIATTFEFLLKPDIQSLKRLSDYRLQTAFTHIGAITGDAAKSFFGSFRRANPEDRVAGKALNVRGWQSASSGAILFKDSFLHSLRAVFKRAIASFTAPSQHSFLSFLTDQSAVISSVLARQRLLERLFAHSAVGLNFPLSALLVAFSRTKLPGILGVKSERATTRQAHSRNLLNACQVKAILRAVFVSSLSWFKRLEAPRALLWLWSGGFNPFPGLAVAFTRAEFSCSDIVRLPSETSSTESTIQIDRHGCTLGLDTQYNHSITVYNLSVEGVPEYFANGILVHNCSFCVARNANVYPVGKVKVPAHPRCRCILLPYRKSWADMGLTDDEFIEEYASDRLDDLKKAGLKPNKGLTPFEKAAGLTEPPKPIWSPKQ